MQSVSETVRDLMLAGFQQEVTMSDEVWWVRRSKSWIEFYRSKSDAVSQVVSPETGGCGGMFDSIHLLAWREMKGPQIKDGEIIPIRPLRVERVEVKNDR